MSRRAGRRRANAAQQGFGLSGTVILVAGVLVVGALLGAAIAGGLDAGKKSPAAESQTGPGSTTAPPTTAQVTSTTSRQQALAHLLSLVTMTPAGPDVAPGATVTLRAPGATLQDVVVRTVAPQATTTSTSPLPGASPSTTQVAGHQLSGQEWQSTGLLVPSTRYVVSYSVSGPGGLSGHGSRSFHTSAPAHSLTASIWPVPGLSVGIGEPVQFTFSRPLTSAQQSAVLSRAEIAMSKPVPGGWHWFSPTDLHFRPTHFWPSGEQVEAVLNLAGWDLGQGTWGVGVYESGFVIGNAHVSVVNLATHEMTVSNNGHVIYQWPISAGAAQWPTQDGIHIVLDRTSKVQMISSTVGIPVNSPNGYDETVYWDTQISYSGEYVHAAPWSVSEQGIINVSHGCVNVSPARAEAFFHFSRVGDVVDVIDGARPPLATDGGVEDWSFPASVVAWTPAKVVQLTTTVTLLPTTTEPPPPGAPTTVAPLPTLPPGGPTVTDPVQSTYPPYTPPATTVWVPPSTTVASTTSTGSTTSTTTPKPTTTKGPATSAPQVAPTTATAPTTAVTTP